MIEVSTTASGDAGQLSINTERLILQNGGVLFARTAGSGQAGTLNIAASESVEITGTSTTREFASGINAEVAENATGEGGNVTIATGRLSLRDGGQIVLSTLGAGDAGTLNITADQTIQVVGASAGGNRSLITAGVGETATGQGGTLQLSSDRLSVREGGAITVGTSGRGNAGGLNINTNAAVEVIGTSPNGERSSVISAGTALSATGDGGDVTISTQQFAGGGWGSNLARYLWRRGCG
ncbi:MAG: hypothetical protein HC888_16410 [Candidatus Competibacteraceae bacterium]|nr:hypothetical protein [Candidatus Competibacteraceae bacterium]